MDNMHIVAIKHEKMKHRLKCVVFIAVYFVELSLTFSFSSDCFILQRPATNCFIFPSPGCDFGRLVGLPPIVGEGRFSFLDPRPAEISARD